MKICTFCGCKTDDKNKICASCGSSQFLYECPNCQNRFEGAFCPDCGTRFNAVAHTCPNCSTKYFSKACPNCGYIAGPSTYTPGSRYNIAFGNNSNASKLALIFGVLGIFVIPIPFSIIAIVLSVRDKRENGNNNSFSKVGMVLGIVGLALACLYLMMMFIGLFLGAAR